MLLYICTGLVLFSVVNAAQVKPLESSINKPNNDAPKAEAIFADVIKNISRVNNVLQELINNYEQLQKIYKSQENVESVYSDSEIDEIFKSKNGKKAKRTKDGDGDGEVTNKPNSVKLATQMFWSDHDDEDNDDSNEDDTMEVKKEKPKETTKKINTLEPKQQNLAVSRKTTTLKPVTSEESSDDSSDTSSSQEVKKRKEKIIRKPDVIKLLEHSKPKQQAELIFIDTHRKPKTVLTNSRMEPKEVKTKPNIESAIQFAGIPTKPKTRYNKVSHSNSITQELKTQNVIPKASINDTRKVKKILYAESFSPKKIWNDIINNTPIQLEAHNEITLRRVEKAKSNKTRFHKRSKNGKAAVMIITKSKKEAKQEPASSDDDDLTNKEELKTNVLRQAYGDACLKLVLRKCHKACKKASKSVCNQVNCKSAVKSSFKSLAKTGCIKEFQGQNEAQQQDPIITNYRGQDRSFVDMTRGGFLSAACLPHVAGYKEIALRNDTPANRTDPDQNFNILRDRFERACKKISSRKCNKACSFAYTNMCEKHECSKRMKKVFKKSCKTKCRSAYDLNDKDSDSDSDSDEDSDDDDSDSGSSSD